MPRCWTHMARGRYCQRIKTVFLIYFLFWLIFMRHRHKWQSEYPRTETVGNSCSGTWHLYAILGHKYSSESSSHTKRIYKPIICTRKWVLSYLFPSLCVCAFQTFDLDLVSDSSNRTRWVLIWPCLREFRSVIFVAQLDVKWRFENVPGISDRLLEYYPNDIDAHIDSEHLSVSSVTLSATVETIHFLLCFFPLFFFFSLSFSFYWTGMVLTAVIMSTY